MRPPLILLSVLTLTITSFLLFVSCESGDGQEGEEFRDDRISALFEPIPPEAPVPEDNPMTEEKIDLGHMLFFEPRLSRSGIISCNSCHVVGAAGVDHRGVAVGEQVRLGPRRTATARTAGVLNSPLRAA